MAPFRSSRSTRQYDPNTATPRVRGGGIDHDPTEGLPVSNWVLADVEVKQDPESPNAEDSNQQDQGSISYPYPEHPVPNFFGQLPAHSQELLRRARAGSRRTTTSVYDRKTETYSTPSAASELKLSKSKLAQANRLLANNAGSPGGPDENDDDDEEMLLDGEKKEESAAKVDLARTFTVKKWVQVPAAVAEKMEERRYLAPRRPGMPSLYGRGGVAAVVNGVVAAGLVEAPVAAVAVDAGAMGAGGNLAIIPPPAGTPTKGPGSGRSIPPKRKKRLGGPGRKKAVVVFREPLPGENAGGADLVGVPVSKEGEESDSEGEGSEEGEIDEEDGEKVATPGDVAAAAATVPVSVSDVQVEELVVEIELPPPSTPVLSLESEPPMFPAVVEEEVEKVADEADVLHVSDVPAELLPPPLEMEIDAIAVSEVEAVEPETAAPAAPAEPPAEEEVDLLGSLDAAVDKDIKDAGDDATAVPSEPTASETRTEVVEDKPII